MKKPIQHAATAIVTLEPMRTEYQDMATEMMVPVLEDDDEDIPSRRRYLYGTIYQLSMNEEVSCVNALEKVGA